MKKIDYSEHDCMCGEEDEFGQILECDPPRCEIHFCPVKQLLSKVGAAERYCLNTIETTKDFPNWLSPIRDEMRQILKILGSSYFTTKDEGK